MAEKEIRRRKPALTPEARENQMISLAVNLAEQRMMDGTASSQLIVHYLKMAADQEKRKLENQLLETQVELAKAKTSQIESEQRTEELYAQAIEAMKRYGGQTEDEY